jgi:hypothetical protein
MAISCLFTVQSCQKTEYPIEPEIIECISFAEVVDPQDTASKKGKLVFLFTDGDGDIGLNPEDTLYPFNTGSEYYYNLFIDYYERQNGTFVKVDLPVPMSARIPRMSNHTPEPIEVKLSIDIFLASKPKHDTIFLSFYLVDRELHKSNVMESPLLVRNRD